MAKAVNEILGTDVEGLIMHAMQQGGIGLLLTVLIITVPPAAAMFFQGTVGSFAHFSGFSAPGASGNDKARLAQGYQHPPNVTQDSGHRDSKNLDALGPVAIGALQPATPKDALKPAPETRRNFL